jgi:hypothetical protein
MRHPDSDAESTAWPMICEHADPCPQSHAFNADGAWRVALGAKAMRAHGRCHLAAAKACDCDSKRGGHEAKKMTRRKRRETGVGVWRSRRSKTMRSSIRADLRPVCSSRWRVRRQRR